MDPHPLTRIVIADDHRLFRDGLLRLLTDQPGIEVAAAAANGAETLDAVRSERPDLLLLDIDMPDLDAFAVADRLRAEGHSVRIILLTMHDEIPYLLAASRPDIQGFVLKDAAFEELVGAIHMVATGGRYVSPAIDARPVPPSPLSPREREILACAGDGLTTQQTADRLGIGVKTVETHRAHILQKLGAANITEAVRKVIRPAGPE
ncbi:MAG: response regulator transcription factor [Kiritimatiellia bacterium]|jgi:DNA-binding NarL/FixJ family response regulator|nr:response regulator transcription factor [Kiritimatiellia bacterium]